MSESENHCAPADENTPDAMPENGVATSTITVGDRVFPLLKSAGPKSASPDIPNAEVSAAGDFTIHVGDTEIYESAPVEFFPGIGIEVAKPVEWLWPGRVPLGMVTIVEGASETGKSWLVIDLAARVSRGALWPGQEDGPQQAGQVLFLCGNLDDWEGTYLSRLSAAGASVGQVAKIPDIKTFDPGVETRGKATTTRRFRLPQDVGHIEFNLWAYPDVRLVVIDALAPFCANATAYREALRKLNEIAARRNVAIVVVSCPARQPSRNRLALSADRRHDEVRCVFNTLADLEDETLYYLAPARMTFAAKPQWLPYRIAAGGIVWEAPIEAPIESRGVSEAVREKGALCRDAMAWLQNELRDGPVAQKAIVRLARESGYSFGTLKRARTRLGVRSQRIGFGPLISYWAWVLDPKKADEAAPGDTLASPEQAADRCAATAANGKSEPGGTNGADERFAAEIGVDLEALNNEIRALSQMMTPELVTQILRGGSMDDFDRNGRLRTSRRNGRNGKHPPNGKHGPNGRHSNGKPGSNGKGPNRNGRKTK